MFIARSDKNNFASGEVSSLIRFADDLQRHRTGVAVLENFVVLIEAVLARRPGTRFVAPVKTEGEASLMVPFRYDDGDYYMLLFNGGKMRLGRDGGIAEASPGVPFELTVPWLAGDLPNLRSAPTGNTVTQACAGKMPQVVTRSGALSWAIADYVPENGPVDTQNLDTAKTVRASAISGSITLSGAGSPFSADWVGGIMRLDEPSQSIVPLWQANESITVTQILIPGATANIGDMTDLVNAFDENPGTDATKTTTSVFAVGRSYSPASGISQAVLSPVKASGTGTVTLELRAKTGAAPADYAADGVLLAQDSYDYASFPASERTLTVANPEVLAWDHIWIYGSFTGGDDDVTIAEVALRRFDDQPTPDVQRRWQKNVYQAIAGGSTGTEPPTHDDGDWRALKNGVVWRYLHDGGGYVKVTAVTDGNNAAGTVLSRLPDSVIDNPSHRWWPPAWGAGRWPELVQTFKQRYVWFRKNVYWHTRPATVADFKFTADAEGAVARRLIANSGSLVNVMWALGKSVLVLGTRDGLWVTRAARATEAFSAENIDDDPEKEDGSAKQIPVLVDDGAIFIGKSRKHIHYVRFGKLADELTVDEITVASRHIWRKGATKIAWQRDPHRVLWIILDDGSLASITFMPGEKITGAAARHPMPNCVVEDIAALPTLDDGYSELWLQTRRTIDGATRRYYEVLTDFFEPADADAPTAEGAWFVDCGLRYQGVATSTITGLGHLEGETVRVFADGLQQTDKVVAGGAIALDRDAADVVVGLPIAARVADLPRNIVNQQGSTKGLPQRASHVQVTVEESVGGTVSVNDSEPEAITETGTEDYAAPMPLASVTHEFFIASETRDEVTTEIVFDNAYPATVLGIVVGNEVEEAE